MVVEVYCDIIDDISFHSAIETVIRQFLLEPVVEHQHFSFGSSYPEISVTGSIHTNKIFVE
jgi:hypothetical protein